MPDPSACKAQLPTARLDGTEPGTSSSRIIGQGEMAELIRGFDWERSRLGPVEKWPDILVTTINLLLASRHPMFLWWGTDLIQFYNDSYRPSISAEKHPGALGQRGIECWPEIWPLIGTQIETVMDGGSTFHMNQLVPITRNGRLEEVFWTYSYSPVRGSDGTVQGTLVVCSETTEQVLSERRLRTLLDINVETSSRHPPSEFQTLPDFGKTIVEKLRQDPADCPFAALFMLSGGRILGAESTYSNSALADPDQWPLAKLTSSQTPLLVEDLHYRFGNVICGPWLEPVTDAYLLPLSVPWSSVQAVLILGISPRLPFDHGYQTFFQLLGARIASLLQHQVLQWERIERSKALEHQAAVLAEKAALLDLTQAAIVVRDMRDRILFWNSGAESMYGWTSQEAIGRNTFELLKTEFFGTVEAMRSDLLSRGHWEGESTQQRCDGSKVTVSSRAALQSNADGDPVRILTIDNDITTQKQIESRLRVLTERLSLATGVAKVGVWEWDLATNSVTWDATMFDMYGFPTVVPMPYEQWAGAVHPEDLPETEAILRNVIDAKGRGSAEFRIIMSDGALKNISAVEAVVLDERGNVSRVIGVNIDVTERKKAEEALRKSQAEMTRLAEHDFLTGLPNRILLYDRLNQAIGMALRQHNKVAVLFLDLDGFKHINDSLGHSVGDKLLQSITQRLLSCVRSSDTVSRQGGDEFILLLSEVDPPEDTAIAARRLLKAVAEPHTIGGRNLHVTASIGVSVYPEDGLDTEALIKNADTAMYQAKGNGRNSFQFFKQEMNIRAVERQSIEESLRRALEQKEFALHYQPKINLKTGEITGAEALLRWTHPTRGPISPAKFIPVAEDSGLILPIGRWVVREACQQAQVWIDTGLPPVVVAVNISGVEFRNERFLDDVFAILEDTGLDPRLLELELTESVLMNHLERTESVLKALRGSGVQLSIDDFGTGYSSLSYLRKFHLDALKIDQSFVREISGTSEHTTIVSAIIQMGRSLNLRVVAEGIETPEELAFLQANECAEGQGYYFSRPVNPMEFAKLLETGTKKHHVPTASV